MLIGINPEDGAVMILSPRTRRPIAKILNGQLILQEGHGESKCFWHIPIPMLAKADAVVRLGKNPAELEEFLGVAVSRP